MAGLIEQVLATVLQREISDLILSAGKPPAMRVLGKIVFASDPAVVPAEEIDRFRLMVLGQEREELYQRNGSADASWTLPGSKRFRLNFFTSAGGPSAAIRPIYDAEKLDLEKLNLPPLLGSVCQEPRGLVLVTGSTGSGKSTALAAMINCINRKQKKHILTIEDPIEFLHKNNQSAVSQREITSRTGGFADAMRSALRENPDVIVIGEMRDLDTAQAAISAALTGHLVISTLHTADTVQSVERLINMYPEHQQERAALDLSMALVAVISLRLIPMQKENRMIPAAEILLGTPTVRKAVADRNFNTLDDALRRGSESGMVTFNRAIFQRYREGSVSLDDALRSVSNPDEFNLLVKGMEGGVDAFRSHYGDGLDTNNALVDMRFLLRIALEHGASDMHLTVNTRPTFRINGILRPVDLPALDSMDIQRLLFSVISPRQRIQLDENRELDFALSVRLNSNDKENNETARFRVNAFFQRGTLGVVARVVNTVIPSPQELLLPRPLLELVKKHQGLILVTGPTGSGKSTTLACLIDQINRSRNGKIITIEDPIEFVHSNQCSIVEQRELHSDTLSFASALKYALRQDPDVIMVGEMRDTETIAAALTAAETGHLVFATIHTNSAPQTVDRIVDSFPNHQQNQIRQQLAGVILGIVSQRLLPRLDRSGRVAAFEVLIGTPPAQSLIREGKSHQLQSVLETSYKDGMITLEKSMEKLYNEGVVSLESTKVYQADYQTTQSF